MRQIKKASQLYGKQNTLIHRAFSALGLPYSENKEVWLKLMAEIAGRSVTGLSELSLWERHQVLVHLRSKGQRIFAPAVPVEVRSWKKGDEDIEYGFRMDADPQVRMVFAMWAEMGYRQKTLRGLCWKLFEIQEPRWLDDRQLSHLVNVVQGKARSKGLGKYYKRRDRSATA